MRKYMLKKHINIEMTISLTILFASMFIFAVDGIDFIKNSIIGYDEGYNATVAANFARYGQYMASYPGEIYFYNMITTGQTVLVPAAVLYKICGINSVTTGLVPLIYGLLSFIVLYALFCMAFKMHGSSLKFRHIISTGLTVCILLTDSQFYYYSTHLIGEGAALFYILVSALSVAYFYQSGKNTFIFLSGASLTAAYITKSSMIFIFVSLIGILCLSIFVEKVVGKKSIVFFICGIAASFLIFDSIKLFQLGGLRGYVDWYKGEWHNMLNQSGGIDATLQISEKCNTFHTLLNMDSWICLLMILLPVILYVIHLIRRFMGAPVAVLYGEKVFTSLGVAGSSLLIYYLLFGGAGLNYPRRLSVNSLLVRISCAFIIVNLIIVLVPFLKKMRNSRFHFKYRGYYLAGITLFAVMSCTWLFPSNTIVDSKHRYLEKKHTKDYDVKLMEQFLSEIDNLPKDAVIYVNGWWQEPNITLYLERKMVDIHSVDANTISRDNAYFIVGRRFDNELINEVKQQWEIEMHEIDNIMVNYDMLNRFNSEELFTIMEIIPDNSYLDEIGK